jgi:phosphomethylpyrimidine synthase
MTQLECARNKTLTPLMRRIAAKESVGSGVLMKRIGEGRVVILSNNKHAIKNPCAVGYGLSTKVNANLGTSTDKTDFKGELRKLEAAVEAGADTVMDLSVGGQVRKIRGAILKHSCVPVGTVPVYEIAVNTQKLKGDFLEFSASDMLENLRIQAREGVDFFTIHAGVTRKSLTALKSQKRLLGIVSRGGAILASWINRHKKENPFYEYFDEILKIAYEYDVTLSLGDGLRPGSILDATDRGQLAELRILGELALRARRKNVQVMIEGPGHVPLHQIQRNVALQKKICRRAPLYVLGPLVTDVAAGYDHINASIGGAIAASFGADFLCYVTASEHLRHPRIDDVRKGVVAARIAAHAADISKGIKTAIDWDRRMSLARRKRDWKKQIRLSLDPQMAKLMRASSRPKLTDVCTMCGRYCSIKLMDECVRV